MGKALMGALCPRGWHQPVRDRYEAEVLAEMDRQDAKWGAQRDLPMVDPVLMGREGGCTPLLMAREYEMPTAGRAQLLTDVDARVGDTNWGRILVEEVSEVIGAAVDLTPEAVRRELVQVEAVCRQMRQAIDRKAGA